MPNSMFSQYLYTTREGRLRRLSLAANIGSSYLELSIVEPLLFSILYGLYFPYYLKMILVSSNCFISNTYKTGYLSLVNAAFTCCKHGIYEC